MANIYISDLKPVGSELFISSESYMSAISEEEFMDIQGGRSTGVCRQIWRRYRTHLTKTIQLFAPLPSPKRPDIPFSA